MNISLKKIIAFAVLSTFMYCSLNYKNIPVIYSQSDFKNPISEINISKISTNRSGIENNSINESMKYLLHWYPEGPFYYAGYGNEGFKVWNCKYTNCYLTNNRSYLPDYAQFSVVIITSKQFASSPTIDLPLHRNHHQKFVFMTLESADNYPICKDLEPGYFNWTWTYRLDSDMIWSYVIIKNIHGRIIGPKPDMHWIKLEDMKPVTPELKILLQNKTKAAACFVSNCRTRSKREDAMAALFKEMLKLNLTVDVYGKCGPSVCSRDNEEACDLLIGKNYYFYLAFENSFSEDYVTEKLLRALNNNAVPIVYGGANYSRFMPDGIYLDARKLEPYELALKINELMHDHEKYFEYFKWRNHYIYERRALTSDTSFYCDMCAMVNNDGKMREVSVYTDFKKWWNPPYRTCEPNA